MPPGYFETKNSFFFFIFYPASATPRLGSRLIVTTLLVVLFLCTTTLYLVAQNNLTYNSRPDQTERRINSKLRETAAGMTRAGQKTTRGPRIVKTRQRLPGCIIIGVRKGGTRALLEYMNIHPNISIAQDEVHFFNNNSRYSLGLDWYRRQMPFTSNHQITVEKTPAYFTTVSVPTRIYSTNTSIKVVLIVRDPVTRLISDYAQVVANNAKSVKMPISFERQVTLPDGTINTNYKAVRIGMYSVYIQRWLRYFPRAQIHVVDGDVMVKEPLSEMRKVENYLGLKPFIESRHIVYNTKKGFFCRVKKGTLSRCLNDSKGRPHPKVSLAVIGKLRVFYAPYNREFYKLVGKRFNWPEE